MPERTEPRRGRGDQDAAEHVEDQQLGDVDGMDHLRRAEPVLGPVSGQHPDPLEVRPVGEGLDVDRREISGDEAHGNAPSVREPVCLTVRSRGPSGNVRRASTCETASCAEHKDRRSGPS